MKKKKKQSPQNENINNEKTAAQTEESLQNGKSYYSRLVGVHRAVPIILVAVGIFTALCYFDAMTGIFGAAIARFLRGLFSYGAYIVPLLLIVHGIFYPSDVAKKRVTSRLIFSVATVLFISVVAYAIMYIAADVKPEFTPGEYYGMGKAHIGGGLFGSLLAYFIIQVFGSVGLIIITSAVFAVYIVYFFSNESGVVGKICLSILAAIVKFFAAIERGIKSFFKRIKNAKKEKDKRVSVRKSRDLSDDDFFMVDNGMQSFEISELGIKESRTHESIEENPSLHEKVRHKSGVDEEFESIRDEARIFEETARTDEPKTERRRVFHTDIDLDDFVGEKDEQKEDIVYDERPSGAFRTEDSADSIFAKDFDPFDLSTSEKLAAKPSSKAKTKAESRTRTGYTEDISNITAEDVERARRQAEFEMKKRSIMDNFKKEKEREPEVKEEPKSEPIFESYEQEPKSPYGSYESTEKAEEPAQGGVYFDEPQVAPSANENTEKERTGAYSFRPNFDTVTDVYSGTAKSDAFTRETKRNDYERAARFTDFATESTEEKKVPIIESYTPPSPDPISDEVADEEFVIKEERPTITVDREFVSVSEEYDDDEDEVASEFTAEQEDDEDEPEIIPEDERNPKINEYRSMFPELSDDDGDEIPAAGLVFEHEVTEVEETAEPESKDEEDDAPPFDFEPIEKTSRDEVKEEAPKPKKKDYSSYKFPPISILAPEDESENNDFQAEIEDNANKLISTLDSFKVKASVKGVDRGPRITRYEIVPAPGVKVSSVMSLQNDIALNLAAEGIRMEAPIPGKSAIGFEIPNRKPSTVRLRSLLETEEFMGSKSKTTVCIGKDVAGYPVFGDIAKMPHVLIAGATGMGKSVCINSILISMLYKARPDEVKFIMIDPKKVEFTMYNGIPHLLIPVVTDPKQAAGALMWAVEQMEKRYEMIEKMRVRNIEMYNEKVAKDPTLGEPMSKIIVVIDELNDLMLQVRDPVEGLIMSIAQKARAAGIHLIIGTQRPSVDVITGVIKANIPSRIACKVMSNTDSRTILDQKGAEDLLDKGDMLFFPAGKPKPARVQGAFVSDGEVEEIMEFLKSQGGDGENYDNDVMEEIQRNAQRCNKKSSDDFDDDDGDEDEGAGYLNDQKFLDAVNVAVTTGKISTSLLQRKLSIGYGKAAKYVDIMEDMGIVSESNGQKAREVLITKDEWHEKLARISLDDY